SDSLSPSFKMSDFSFQIFRIDSITTANASTTDQTTVRTADRRRTSHDLPVSTFLHATRRRSRFEPRVFQWIKKATHSLLSFAVQSLAFRHCPAQPTSLPNRFAHSWFERAKPSRHHERRGAPFERLRSFGSRVTPFPVHHRGAPFGHTSPLIPRAFSGLRPDSSRADRPGFDWRSPLGRTV